MSYLPYNVTMSYINTCAAVTTGTFAAIPKTTGRINQHVLKSIRLEMKKETQIPLRKCKLTSSPHEYDSAIGHHLLENQDCAAAYNDNQFTVLAVARSSFHLATLQVTFMKNKQPALCRRKEFIYALQLIH